MTVCPTRKIVSCFLHGEFADAEREHLAAHLESCAVCLGTMEELSSDAELRAWAGVLPESSQAVRVEAGYSHMLRGCIEEDDAGTADGHAQEDGLAALRQCLSPPLADGDIGSLDGYRVRAELGRGGMGVVFEAYDEKLERPVAIKLLQPDKADASSRTRFVREGRAVARVKHDGIVGVYGVATPETGPPYLILELIRGASLRQYIKERGPLNPHVAAEICRQAADALDAAHQVGLIHRDIKPSNILLERNSEIRSTKPKTNSNHRNPKFKTADSGVSDIGNSDLEFVSNFGFTASNFVAKITDFGLARITDRDSSLTQIGMLAGTPNYISPEQVRDPERIDPRSDVYSLGVTLYEALTGEVPFRGAPHMVLRQIESDEPRPPRQLNDAVPRDLETICLKAMAKDSSCRYQSARELADDLRRWLGGEPIHARPVGGVERAWRWCRRRPLVAGLAASLILAMFGGFAGIFWQWRRAETNLTQARRHQESAQKSDREARQAIEQYYAELIGASLMSMDGLQELRQKLSTQALEYYQQRTAQESSQDPAIQAELAEAYARLGYIYQSTGNPRAALDEWKRAVAIREELVRTNPDVVEYPILLARSYRAVARQLGVLGERDAADDFHEKARRTAEFFAQQHPDNALLQIELAKALCHIGVRQKSRGEKAAALELQLKSLAIWESLELSNDDHRSERAKVFVNVGEMLLAERPAESLGWFEKACTEWEDVRGSRPHHQEFAYCLAVAYADAGKAQAALDRPAEATEAFAKARQLYQQFLEDDRGRDEMKQALAECYLSLGKLQHQTGQSGEAAASFEQARGIEENLLRSAVVKDAHHNNLACVWDNLGLIHLERGHGESAREAFQHAVESQRLSNSQSADARQTLGEYYRHLARAQRALGQAAESLSSLELARAEYEEIAR